MDIFMTKRCDNETRTKDLAFQLLQLHVAERHIALAPVQRCPDPPAAVVLQHRNGVALVHGQLALLAAWERIEDHGPGALVARTAVSRFRWHIGIGLILFIIEVVRVVFVVVSVLTQPWRRVGTVEHREVQLELLLCQLAFLHLGLQRGDFFAALLDGLCVAQGRVQRVCFDRLAHGVDGLLVLALLLLELEHLLLQRLSPLLRRQVPEVLAHGVLLAGRRVEQLRALDAPLVDLVHVDRGGRARAGRIGDNNGAVWWMKTCHVRVLKRSNIPAPVNGLGLLVDVVEARCQDGQDVTDGLRIQLHVAAQRLCVIRLQPLDRIEDLDRVPGVVLLLDLRQVRGRRLQVLARLLRLHRKFVALQPRFVDLLLDCLTLSLVHTSDGIVGILRGLIKRLLC
eukprot:m.235885 g.235885  ORF g.235885 m.235885 type:complete len:397 (+) comp12898_c0_seq1:713-1903(+)